MDLLMFKSTTLTKSTLWQPSEPAPCVVRRHFCKACTVKI